MKTENETGRAFHAKVTVGAGHAAFIRRVLSTEPRNESECFGEDETISYTAEFEDGCQMDIKCCGVQYEEGGCNTAWSEAVLFNKKGAEIACSDPDDQFFRVWKLAADGNTYSVEAVAQTMEEMYAEEYGQPS